MAQPSRGMRIGPYEIVGWLGAGGMGDVYRARDARLGRDVAIKLIAGSVVSDGTRVRRFEQEARAAGQLNHPGILAVYDTGIHDGAPYIVSELLEGETLRGRLQKGALSPRKAIDYARQAAEGLAAAHDKGIVHRDVKPDNLFITSDDRIKILDFGIAKLSMADEAGAGQTGWPTDTAAGTVVGTAGYMSPEQARGEAVDARSDIFSLGAVLYEMVTGSAAFARPTGAETLAAILKDEPAPVPANEAPALARIVARCLEKSRETRFQSARDLGFALDVLSSTGATAAALLPASLRFARLRRPAVAWGVAGLLALGLAGTAAWSLLRSVPPPVVTRATLTLPPGQTLAGARHNVAMSSDGTQIVYSATNRVFVRATSDISAKPTDPAEVFQGTVSEPVFSPDGRSIAFFAVGDQTLKRIAVTGGAPVTIGRVVPPFGTDWGPGGIILGQGNKGIVRVSADGGTPETIVSVRGDEVAQGPHMLPDGEHVLFTLVTGTDADRWDKANIVVQSIKSGKRDVLIRGGSDARYAPTGHIVYALSGKLVAIPFDADRLRVEGDPVTIVEGVSRGAANTSGAANFSFSDNGSLIYIPGPVSALTAQLALTDRNGVVEPLKIPPGPYSWPRVSPDGTRIVFGSTDGQEAIVWVYDLSGTSAMRQLTYGGNNRFPVWASNTRVAFQSDRDGAPAVFWQAADGSGSAERLTSPAEGESHVPEAWSPVSETLLFAATKGSDVSLWMYSARDRRVAPFGGVRSSLVPPNATFSPDGRWIAYTTNERGPIGLTVQPFPATGARYQLVARASDDPHHAVWSPDGKELFYIPRPSGFESINVAARQEFVYGNPRALPAPFLLGPPSARRAFDMTPGGAFLGLIFGAGGQSGSGPSAIPQIQVVYNWFEELKARVPRR